MPLTSAQRKRLRQAAQKLEETARLGKAGLSEAFVKQVQTLLAQRELVKLRFGNDIQGDARQTLGAEIAQAAGAELVAVVGHTVLLYQPNPALDPKKRVL